MTTETELRDIPKTCNGLFLWIDRQMKSHDLKAVTGMNWLGSCKKLFGFDDPGWEEKDPVEMDWVLLCDRARNAGVKATSVDTYKSKAKEAVKQFGKFQENPSAYKAPVFKGNRHHGSTSEILSLPPSTATPPVKSPIEIHQGFSQDRHIHLHIHLSKEIYG